MKHLPAQGDKALMLADAQSARKRIAFCELESNEEWLEEASVDLENASPLGEIYNPFYYLERTELPPEPLAVQVVKDRQLEIAVKDRVAYTMQGGRGLRGNYDVVLFPDRDFTLLLEPQSTLSNEFDTQWRVVKIPFKPVVFRARCPELVKPKPINRVVDKRLLWAKPAFWFSREYQTVDLRRTSVSGRWQLRNYLRASRKRLADMVAKRTTQITEVVQLVWSTPSWLITPLSGRTPPNKPRTSSIQLKDYSWYLIDHLGRSPMDDFYDDNLGSAIVFAAGEGDDE